MLLKKFLHTFLSVLIEYFFLTTDENIKKGELSDLNKLFRRPNYDLYKNRIFDFYK